MVPWRICRQRDRVFELLIGAPKGVEVAYLSPVSGGQVFATNRPLTIPTTLDEAHQKSMQFHGVTGS